MAPRLHSAAACRTRANISRSRSSIIATIVITKPGEEIEMVPIRFDQQTIAEGVRIAKSLESFRGNDCTWKAARNEYVFTGPRAWLEDEPPHPHDVAAPALVTCPRSFVVYSRGTIIDQDTTSARHGDEIVRHGFRH